MINDAYRQNFDTLILAAKNDDLALMECTDAVTGEVIMAVCVAIQLESGGMDFMPVAKMFNGNPFDELLPPLDTETMQ